MTHYFLGNTLLSSRSFLRPPLSFAFFCSTCGEVWGRVWTEGEPWKVEEVPCEKHHSVGVWDWGRVAGSFVAGNEITTGPARAALCVEFLPVEVLKREVEIHLNHAERQLHEISNN